MKKTASGVARRKGLSRRSPGQSGPGRDNDWQKKPTEKTEEREERFKTIFENATVGLYRTTPDGRVLMANPALLRMMGYASLEDLAQRSLEENIVGPDYSRSAFKQRVESEGRVDGLESAWKRRDGSTRFVSESARCVRDKAGKVLYYEGTVEDITELKRAEKDLKALSARQDALLAAIPEIIMEVDSQKIYTWANRAAFEFFGEDVIGKEAAFYFEGEQDTYSTVQPVFMGEEDTVYVESWQRRRDGQRRLLAWWCRTIKNSRGNVIGALSTARDITERRQAEDDLRLSYERIQRAVSGAINALGLMAETRDPYTSGHQQRVAQIAVGIARELGLPNEQLETIHVAGILHDIGKVSVPSEILSKPTTLNEIELCLLRNHSQVGFEIVKTLDLPWAIEQIVLQHHERINGSGYPLGLSGERIDPLAKIMAVADVVEAMVSHRPYRAALGLDKAFEEISAKKGILYDPEVVDACLRLFREKAFRLDEKTAPADFQR